MMLAKLMATLASSNSPDAQRKNTNTALAPRASVSIIGAANRDASPPRSPASMLGRDRAQLRQHVAHRRLVLHHLVGRARQQRPHLGDVLGREEMNLPAHALPILLELLREIHFKGLRLGLDRAARLDHELLQ